jgi:hypothetical protein
MMTLSESPMFVLIASAREYLLLLLVDVADVALADRG